MSKFEQFRKRAALGQHTNGGESSMPTEQREALANRPGPAKAQPREEKPNPFGGNGGRFSNLQLKPKAMRREYFPTDTRFEAVRVTRFGYTSFKGACVIEGVVELCTQDPALEGKTFADVYAAGEWQDTFVARFAAAAWGIEGDDPEIERFGHQGAREAVGELLERDFEADPLYLRLETASGQSKKGNPVTNHYWNPLADEHAEALAS